MLAAPSWQLIAYSALTSLALWVGLKVCIPCGVMLYMSGVYITGRLVR